MKETIESIKNRASILDKELTEVLSQIEEDSDYLKTARDNLKNATSNVRKHLEENERTSNN